MSPFLAVSIIVVLAPSLLYLLVRRVEAGLFCLLAVELFNLIFGLNAGLMGGLHISALDGVFFALLLAGLIRFARSLHLLHLPQLLASTYLLVFAASFVLGCEANGLFAAANESRGFVGPLVALLYFADAAVDPASIRRIVRLYLLFGAALCVVAVLAAAGLPVGVAAQTHSAAAADHRYLPSNAAAILAICGFLALARATYAAHRLRDHLWPGVFFLIAIGLRHRTVWAMLLAGGVGLLFVDGRLFRRMLPAALVASVVIAGLVLYDANEPGLTSSDEFADSLTSANTWQWRVSGWQEFLFDADQTPLSVAIGKPLGSGWWRIDPASHLLQTAPPHSEYVTECLRVGIAGLAPLLLFALGPLVVLSRLPREIVTAVYPSTSIWVVLILITLVYGVTYSIEPESYALIGIASAIVYRASVPEMQTSETLAAYRIDSSLAIPYRSQSVHS